MRRLPPGPAVRTPVRRPAGRLPPCPRRSWPRFLASGHMAACHAVQDETPATQVANLDLRGVERHHVRPAARREVSERAVDAEKFRRRRRGESQRPASGRSSSRTQFRTALAMSRMAPASVPSAVKHLPPCASMRRPQSVKAGRLPPTGGIASVTSIGCPAPRNASLSMAGATCSPSTMIPKPYARLFERNRNRPRLAARQRPHRIEQMGEAGEPLRHRSAGLRIGGHRMAERNPRPAPASRAINPEGASSGATVTRVTPLRGVVSSSISSGRGRRIIPWSCTPGLSGDRNGPS